MKVQSILILFLLFQVCLTTALKKFKLEIKDSLEAEADIVLLPGIFTKITLSLKSLDGDDFTFNEDEEKTGYKISFNDEKIVSFTPVLTMIPQESLVYTNFIGFSCSNQIEGDSYDIPIKVELLNSKTDEGSIVYEEKLHVKINRVKTDIKLDLLLNSMAQKSQNFFQLENELFNVDEINISLDDQNSISNKFEFNAISIASFAKRKNNKELDEISKENPANHGILFNCPFFPKDVLASAKFNFNLKLDGETNGLCFNLFKKEFSFELKTEGVINLDADVKTAITYNTDDDTPKYDTSNKIQIHTYIPLAPVILECKFYLNSSFIVGGDVEDQASLQTSLNYEHIFKTVVKSEGKFDINMLNLNASAEYYAQCDISNVGIKDVVSKIKLLIGKFDGADVIRQLIPSRDPNAIPQCVTFTFENILQSAAFFKFGPLYCRYFMKKNDALLARALPTIICESISLNVNDVTLCVAPSPLYNTGRFLSKKETDFNQRFDEFVKKIENFDISDYISSTILKVKKYVREYDNVSIDPDSISVSLKDVNFVNVIHPFTFEIKSTHSQNVECYYNPVLTGENSIFLKYLETKIILAPNETKEVGISKLFTILSKDDQLYSLNLKCYNLPGFLFKYESTGVMNKFSYCNCKDDIDQTSNLIVYTPIDCNEKKNKKHPRCLKVNLISIFQQIRTQVPQRIREIELEIEQFVSAAKSYKMNFLKKLQSDFQNCIKDKKKKIKDIIEKAIELLKYSTSTDCSINSSSSVDEGAEPIQQEQYSECRHNKQLFIGQLLELIKDKLECPSLYTLITSVEDSISDDLEENIKYILFLLHELSNNPESFTQETSKIVLDLVQCIQYQFDKYWPIIEEHLKTKKKYIAATIMAVKKDIEILILQTLQNLGKVINFGQLDGYIAAKKNEITKTGLIICDKAREIQANITLFAKKLIHFGTANYTFSGSMFANIEAKEGINAGAETDTKISLVNDKDIVILTNSNFLLNKERAYALQTLVFESPLVSVKAAAEGEVTSDTVNTFISITLYDKDGNEISIKDIKEAFRPQILYLKEKYSHLKYCYYYDEFKNELVTNGLTAETVTYNGKVYFKCSTSHLTSFTAGTVENIKESEPDGEEKSDGKDNNEGSSTTLVVLIIIGIVLIIAIALVIYILIRRRTRKDISSSTIDTTFNKDDGIVNSD